MLPISVSVHAEKTGHIQGIAVDGERKYIYASFTTELLKFDMQGHLIGSVKGLVGHLGCIAYNAGDGCVYGSLEFKHDCIGEGILRNLGSAAHFEEGFYMAIFDVRKIDRVGMDAERDGVMRAVFLRTVTDDYLAPAHRYGCSGIDGTTVAPAIGADDGHSYLYVAYGIYGDLSRTDNDHQVILQYDLAGFSDFAKPLCQTQMHKSGPDRPAHRYFVYTGNTEFGVQNLEYDPYTKRMLLSVYRGRKPDFPNYPMFTVDMTVAPRREMLRGLSEEGELLSLTEDGERDGKTGVCGFRFGVGSTGIAALGDGLYYFSHNHEDWKAGIFESEIRLYRWDGKAPFVPVLPE